MKGEILRYRITLQLTITSILFFFLSCNSSKQDVFSSFSPNYDLALNDGTFKYPNPTESDDGWGAAVYPWQIIDGIRGHYNNWNYGLAFSGGKDEYMDTCGWRQATINFGKKIKFNRTVIWFHECSVSSIAKSYVIQYWSEEEQNWKNAKIINTKQEEASLYIQAIEKKKQQMNSCFGIPCEDTFKTVYSSKVRYSFNNCDGDHGWINEFEVYYDQPVDRPERLIIIQ